jgi:hypothetical protein
MRDPQQELPALLRCPVIWQEPVSVLRERAAEFIAAVNGLRALKTIQIHFLWGLTWILEKASLFLLG